MRGLLLATGTISILLMLQTFPFDTAAPPQVPPNPLAASRTLLFCEQDLVCLQDLDLKVGLRSRAFRALDLSSEQTCTFEICGGLANQRIALIEGILACMILNLTVGCNVLSGCHEACLCFVGGSSGAEPGGSSGKLQPECSNLSGSHVPRPGFTDASD